MQVWFGLLIFAYINYENLLAMCQTKEKPAKRINGMNQLEIIVKDKVTFAFWPSDKSESNRIAKLCETAYDNELTNMVSKSAENQYLLVDSPVNRYCVLPIVKFFKISDMVMVVCINRQEKCKELYAAYHFETGLRATTDNAPSIDAAKRQTRRNIKKYSFDQVVDLLSARKMSKVTNVLIK